MEEIFYLKGVIALIENSEYREPMELLLQKVREQGICGVLRQTAEDAGVVLKQEESGKEEIRQEEVRKEEVRKEEIRKEEVRKEEIRKEESRKEEIRKEEIRKEEVRQEGIRKEEEGQEGIRQEEPKQEERKREETEQKEMDRKILRKTGIDKGILWITDSPVWAAVLQREGEAVLVYLHSGNRNGDFSSLKYVMEEPQELDGAYLDRVYRRFAGIPWDILDTERCRIRETVQEDVEAFYEIYKEPSITQYMEPLYPEAEQERQYIRDYIDKVYGFYGFGIWTVVLKATGEVIGRAGLNFREGYEEPEIGFVIGVPWQRQGIAYEICSAILEYGAEELGFQTVQALVEPENEASLTLCGKLGFQIVERISDKGQEYFRLLREP